MHYMHNQESTALYKWELTSRRRESFKEGKRSFLAFLLHMREIVFHLEWNSGRGQSTPITVNGSSNKYVSNNNTRLYEEKMASSLAMGTWFQDMLILVGGSKLTLVTSMTIWLVNRSSDSR